MLAECSVWPGSCGTLGLLFIALSVVFFLVLVWVVQTERNKENDE